MRAMRPHHQSTRRPPGSGSAASSGESPPLLSVVRRVWGMRCWSLCFAVLATLGCATTEPVEEIRTVEKLSRLLRDQGLEDPKRLILPYALDDEMRAWVQAKVTVRPWRWTRARSRPTRTCWLCCAPWAEITSRRSTTWQGHLSDKVTEKHVRGSFPRVARKRHPRVSTTCSCSTSPCPYTPHHRQSGPMFQNLSGNRRWSRCR